MRDFFHKFARKTAEIVGTPATFIIAMLMVIGWALTGPIYSYSDTWQLIINTGTTILTFLIVFLIQNSQNHDAQAIHLKLDELIRAIKGARNSLVDLEDFSDEEMKALADEFRQLRERYKGISAYSAATVEQALDERQNQRQGRTPK